MRRRQLAEAGSKCQEHTPDDSDDTAMEDDGAGRRRQLQQHDGPFPQPAYMPSNCGPEYLVLPGLDEALIYDWRGDNAGPPLTIDEVKKTWKIVQGKHERRKNITAACR
jgi:hypothetical protein